MRILREVVRTTVLTAWLWGGFGSAQRLSMETAPGNGIVETPSPIPSRPVTPHITRSETAAQSTLPTPPSYVITPPGPIHIGEPSNFKLERRGGILEGTDNQNISVLLAQTSAEDGMSVTKDNSWWLVKLSPCNATDCVPEWIFDNGVLYSQWTFNANKDLTMYSQWNYFICVVMGPKVGNEYQCSSVSSFFDILRSVDVSILPSAGGPRKTEGTSINDGSDSTGSNVDAGNNTPFTPGQNDLDGDKPIDRPKMNTPPLLTMQNDTLVYNGILPQYDPRKSQVEPTSTMLVTSTLSATPTNNVSAPTVTSESKKLSTGAIVGIVLGVLVLLSLLAALAFFFCLKRRRRQNSAQKHEQVMLTQAHGANNSQDLINEKDAAVTTLIHPNSNDSTFSHREQMSIDASARQTLISPGGIAAHHSTREDSPPQTYHHTDGDLTRDIQLAPYMSTAHDHQQQHTSPPVTSNHHIPRRNLTNASTAPSAVSALSRNTSTTSTLASRDGHHQSSSNDYHQSHHLQQIGEEPTQATSTISLGSDPRYGDARHTPTFHSGGDGSVSIAEGGGAGGRGGFLSEPGMSPEEVARLEEEERRIDEAIAAADRERERARGVR